MNKHQALALHLTKLIMKQIKTIISSSRLMKPRKGNRNLVKSHGKPRWDGSIQGMENGPQVLKKRAIQGMAMS